MINDKNFLTDSHLGITLKNAWKLITMGKELIFSCKDKNDKREWIEQILKRVECSPPTAEERRLVRDTLCSICKCLKLTINY